MTPRIVAIDWSGAEKHADKKIWLAEVDPTTRRVVRLEDGRDRDAMAAHLIAEAARTPEMVVGIDFAFSLPAWFLEQRGHIDAPALWDDADHNGERWLAECASPFWGRPGTRRPELPDHFRRTDREIPPVDGIRPKSVFQIGGAGAVGTGSIRGMPILKQLREGGYAIWPFDAPRFPLVAEIYPRALTGSVDKGSAEARQRYLSEHYAWLDDEARELAVSCDDAFDALVSALVMAAHVEELASLPPAADEQIRREGQIWLPATAAARSVAPRRLYDSSRTRVGPVFSELVKHHGHDTGWVPRLLDLAAGDSSRDRCWWQRDLTVVKRYWEPSEHGLQPPVSLLSWLIRNLDPPPGRLDGEGEVEANRRKLAERDPDTIDGALRLLRSAGLRKGWHVLEGPTYPDVYLVTRDALIVIEGKRTEAGPTTRTTWMEGRQQMHRHLDAAWEVRGHRAVYGLLIVEGEDGTDALPDVWRHAADELIAPEVLARSLPHRSRDEQEGIGRAFIGATTWQRVVREFDLPLAL